MALEFATQEEIPEAIRSDFVEIDGKWVPDGYVPKESRDNKVQELQRLKSKYDELEKAAARWNGVDPDKAKAAITELQELKDKLATKKAGVADEELEKLLEERTERMRADLEAKLQAAAERANQSEEQAQTLKKTLENKTRDDALVAAAIKAGVYDKHFVDVLNRGRNVFEVSDGGKLEPKKDDGSPFYGPDGKSLITPEEWVHVMRQEAPGWFPANADGGGASTAGGRNSGLKVKTRKEFSGLSAEAKAAFMRDVREGKATLED